MAWVNICSKTYDSNYSGAHVKVVIQYDNSSITITSLTCRAIGYLTDYNGSYGDTYFIYSSDGGISRICYRGGTSTKKDGSVYYTSNNFTLSKTETATSFKLPEVRLCNDGSHHDASVYTDYNGRGHAIYWNDQRHMWTTVNSGGNTINTTVYVTDVRAGTVTITDNYNNTFSVTGTKGADGAYNPATGPTLSWGYDTNYGNAISNPNSLAIVTAANASRRVYAKGVTGATHGDDAPAATYADIRQYVAPPTPTSATLTTDKSRVTMRGTWTFSWPKVEGTNSSSPVVGYRIRAKRTRQGTEINLPIINSRSTGTTDYSKDNYCFDTDDTGYPFIADKCRYYTDDTKCYFEIYPEQFSDLVQPGDYIGLRVHAYTRKGKNNTGAQIFSADWAKTIDTEVNNAGIVHVKVGNEWKEGQVWVKANGSWHEAETVNVKTANGWKESQ